MEIQTGFSITEMQITLKVPIMLTKSADQPQQTLLQYNHRHYRRHISNMLHNTSKVSQIAPLA